MANGVMPWDKYAAQPDPQQDSGPWTKYSSPTAPPSVLDRAKQIGSQIWSGTPLGIVSDAAGRAKDWLAKKAESNDEANLSAAANGQVQPHGRAVGFGYRALGDIAGMVKGATSPTGAGIMAAGIAAPEIVGPALLAHGLYGAEKSAPEAIEGYPDAVAQGLGSLAEAAGGGAMSGTLGAKVTGRTLTPVSDDRLPAAGSFQPARAVTSGDVVRHAAQEGIDLTPAQATGSRVAKTVQAVGERSLMGGEKLGNAMEASRAAFGQSAGRFADRLDPYRSGLSDEAAGEHLQQSAAVAKDIAHTNATDAYTNIAWLDKEPVDVTGIRKDFYSKLKQAQPVLDNAPPEIAAKIRGALERGAQLGTKVQGPGGMAFSRPELSFRDAIQLRSFFREMGDTSGADLPKQYQGLFRNLAQQLDGAMEKAAAKAGGVNEWRSANAGWKDYANKYGDRQSPLYRTLQQSDPAKVTRSILSRGSAADVETLKNEGIDVGPLQRRVLDDIARGGFRVTRDGLGGYSHSFLNTLFGKSVDELYLKSEIGRRLGWEVNPSGTSDVLLGAHQLSAMPNRWMVPMGAAKISMPRSASEFLPSSRPPLSMSGRTLGALAATTNPRNE